MLFNFHFFILSTVNKWNAVTEKIKWKSQLVYIHCIWYGLLFQIKFHFWTELECKKHVLRMRIAAYHLSCRLFFMILLLLGARVRLCLCVFFSRLPHFPNTMNNVFNYRRDIQNHLELEISWWLTALLSRGKRLSWWSNNCWQVFESEMCQQFASNDWFYFYHRARFFFG